MRDESRCKRECTSVASSRVPPQRLLGNLSTLQVADYTELARDATWVANRIPAGCVPTDRREVSDAVETVSPHALLEVRQEGSRGRGRCEAEAAGSAEESARSLRPSQRSTPFVVLATRFGVAFTEPELRSQLPHGGMQP